MDNATRKERLQAVKQLRCMTLPVSDVATMKKESVPEPADLMPGEKTHGVMPAGNCIRPPKAAS